MQFARPIPFKEALDKLGQKTVVASGLSSEEWSRKVPTGLRDRAFFSARVESAQFLQRSKDLLGDWLSSAREEITLPDGSKTTALKTGGRADFVEQARRFAEEEGLGPLAPGDKGTLKDITSQKRLELIFNVQTQSAHDFGEWKQGQDPTLLDEFPAQRFVREVDVKHPRIIHQQNEGVVRLKTDLDFWMAMNSPSIGGFGVPYGPWGFNSGMGVEDVDRDEAEQLGLISADERVDPVDTEFNDELKASTEGLDPDVVQFLKDSFGDQVEVQGGKARWVGQSAGPSTPAAPAVATTPLPPSRVPPPAAPTPAPPAPPQTPPRTLSTPPVSAAPQLPTRGKTRQHAAAALAAIDRVHSDGKLDQFPVLPMPAKEGGLGYTQRDRSGKIREVGLRPSGPWPELTMAHEMGHVLDWVVLGGGQDFGSESVGGVLSSVMDAIQKSKAVAGLRSLATRVHPDVAEHINRYLLSPRELWARAYAQFIAEKAGDQTLASQLAKRVGRQIHEQWDTADFAPISSEIESVFRTMKWL